jgi:hypothetical protein
LLGFTRKTAVSYIAAERVFTTLETANPLQAVAGGRLTFTGLSGEIGCMSFVCISTTTTTRIGGRVAVDV